VRVAFTGLLCALDADPPVLEPAGSPLADAVAAVLAAAGAVVRRWGAPVFGLSAWELAAAVTGGRLLAPGFQISTCAGENGPGRTSAARHGHLTSRSGSSTNSRRRRRGPATRPVTATCGVQSMSLPGT